MKTPAIPYVHASLLLAGLCACLCILILPLKTHAQIGLFGVERALSIRFNPLYPKPGDIVSLRVQSSVIDLSDAMIIWRSNGKILAEGRGADTTSVTIGALGTETDIEVSAEVPEGVSASTDTTIIPTELDLLMDSDAYIPPFYRGRALSSTGTSVRLIAVPHFFSAGVTVVDSDIVFTWRRNNEVIKDISGRGKTTARISVDHLFGSDVISVEARTTDGLLSNTTSFALSPTAPVLMLYQNHPLYGITYHQALGATTFFPESEMTFAAIPFFVQATSPDDPSLRFNWRVNGQEIPHGATQPSNLTINADNSSGIALLQLELTHATNYFLDARGSWNITFSARSPIQDVFGGFGE